MLHKKLRLVGYIRSGGTAVGAAQQRAMIEEYCLGHNYNLVGCTEVDVEAPGYGLREAITAAHDNDGLIALDLDRFVKHAADRLLDLRPLIENMMKENKVLITLRDGIETLTANGQHATMEMLNEWSDRESLIAVPENANINFYNHS